MNIRAILLIASHGLVLLGGLGLGYRLYHDRVPKTPVTAQPAIPIKQGQIAAVEPAAPVHKVELPRGTKVLDQVQVTFHAMPDAKGESHIDVTTVEMPDHTKRVAVTSEDGTVLKAVEIPTVRLPEVKELRWAGGAVKTADGKWGGFVSYSRGPFVGGVAAWQGNGMVFLGVRW